MQPHDRFFMLCSIVASFRHGKVQSTRKAVTQSEFSQPKKRKPFTVFLIVDDQAMRQSLVEILKSEKIDVQDYMTAMEFYRDFRESKPGVVISELHLRGMTGIELAEKLTFEKQDVLVTLLAGHADAPAAVKAMQENVLDFLLKPVNSESLLGLVARAVCSVLRRRLGFRRRGSGVHRRQSESHYCPRT